MSSLPVAPARYSPAHAHLAHYATALDAGLHGPHVASVTAPRFSQPLTRALAVPGRLHLYASWTSPGAHRATVVIALLGLRQVMSVSYVDTLRDARGWAFRETTGADPVNGFRFLREAYELSEPGFDGPVSVPVLWDRHESRIASDDPDGIDAGLATAFGERNGMSLYPAGARAEIDEQCRWVTRSVASQLGPSAYDGQARTELLAAFGSLNARLAGRQYLIGNRLTLADVRLWVHLVRYDAGPNAHGAVGPKLSDWMHLWAYARRLHELPAFHHSTRFDAIAAPFATLPPWPALR